jgi:hypothetical protein
MNFPDAINNIERQLSNISLPYELLELHYIPYDFGSGLAAYRIKGYNIQFVFDSKENSFEVLRSEKHEKYTSSQWSSVYLGTYDNFIADSFSSTFTQLL